LSAAEVFSGRETLNIFWSWMMTRVRGKEVWLQSPYRLAISGVLQQKLRIFRHISAKTLSKSSKTCSLLRVK